jgi:hypothetical protein
MRDEDIFDKLFQGVERWPRKDRPAAEEWLARAADSAAPAHSR